jgi:ElaB/YqjD/DUF883 family membrane-anchored ribosome-binding protein
MPDRSTFDEMAQDIREEGSDMAARTKDAIADAARKGKEKVQDLARTTADRIEEKRVGAANALHSASSTLHEKAGDLPGGDKVNEMAHATADKLDAAATYVKEHNTRQMMRDVEATVKRHPGRSILIAAALGFLVGRAFRSDD